MSATGSYGPANVVFTDALRYQTKPNAAHGEIKRATIPSFNKATFAPGDVMQFSIPTRRPNQVLSGRQSYLKFTISNPDANDLAPDYTADSFIEAFELYHGSHLIEQLRQYSALSCLIRDWQGNTNVQAMMEAQHETTARTGATITASGGTFTVCLPIMSGLIGTMSPMYFPAYACSNGDLRAEFTLSSAVTGAVATTAVSSWAILNPELVLEYVELTPAAISKLPKELSYSYESFENVSATIPSGTANEHTLVPFSLSSVKALWSIYRFTSNLTSATAKSVSNRPNPQLAEWQYEVGGRLYPPTPVRSTVETYAECLKAQHGLGVVDDLVQITKTEFELTTAGATDAAFSLAQDLEYLVAGGNKAKSGVDVRGVDIFLEQRWNTATAQAFRLDTFAMFDGTLHIKAGQCTVSK